MKRISLKYCVLFISAMLSFLTEAKDVVMAFSQEIPPYIFQQQNNGIEIDIISAALAHKGHTLKPLYFPLGRIPIAFSHHLVDAAMGDMGVDLKLHGGFYAEPAVIYDNIFITLKSRNISIKVPSDLDLLSIVSFQGAEKRYPKWLKKVDEEKRFYGVSDQLTQVKLLRFGRYDVVLSDRYIFRYFAKQVPILKVLEQDEFEEHNFNLMINPKNYQPIFRDKQVRNDFNQGLKVLKESGEFQKIYDAYMAF
ncbi:MAG: ABC transporter substrate-binding protein [Cognaticolwellia sp.]